MHSAYRDYSKLPAEAVLRLPDVLALVGLCRASIYAKVAEHRFPSPIKLTEHASGWRMGDVREWLADPTGWRRADMKDWAPARVPRQVSSKSRGNGEGCA